MKIKFDHMGDSTYNMDNAIRQNRLVPADFPEIYSPPKATQTQRHKRAAQRHAVNPTARNPYPGSHQVHSVRV